MLARIVGMLTKLVQMYSDEQGLKEDKIPYRVDKPDESSQSSS
jgi:hypothetical protein